MNFKQTITSTGKFIQLLLRRPQIACEEGQQVALSGAVSLQAVSFAYQQRPEQQVLSNVSLEALSTSQLIN